MVTMFGTSLKLFIYDPHPLILPAHRHTRYALCCVAGGGINIIIQNKTINMEQQNQLQTISQDDLVKHLENIGLLKDLTAGEKNTYLQIARAFNLNPFKREIHVSKYNGQMSIITGYETYIKRAERSGMLDGWEVTTSGAVAPVLNDSTLKAVITIYRKDRSRPFIWEAKFTEYMQLKDGKLNRFWQKSETMIKKVVMAQGFRLCFNDELGGMPYSSEEIDTVDISHEDVVAPPPGKKPGLKDKGFNDGISRIKLGEIELVQKLKENYSLSTQQFTDLAAAELECEKLLSAISSLEIADSPADVDSFKEQLPAIIIENATFITAVGKRIEVLMAKPI